MQLLPIVPMLMSARSINVGPALLDSFIPHPDVLERHEIVISAPAALVFEVARNLDIHSISAVRAIFWLRTKVMGANMNMPGSRRLIADMLSIGWERLAEEPDRYFVARAVCQLWKATVTFFPIPSSRFATFAEPDRLKITWTMEVGILGAARTRFATETRAGATDDSSHAKFRRYWWKLGIAIVTIRRLLLAALRREAERRWKLVQGDRAAKEQVVTR